MLLFFKCSFQFIADVKSSFSVLLGPMGQMFPVNAVETILKRKSLGKKHNLLKVQKQAEPEYDHTHVNTTAWESERIKDIE